MVLRARDMGARLAASSLHALVLRPAPPLPRGPPRSQHVRRLTVDAVRRVDSQYAVHLFVDPRGADVCVEPRRLRGYVLPDDEMRGNRVARGVPRLEHRIDLTDGEGRLG